MALSGPGRQRTWLYAAICWTRCEMSKWDESEIRHTFMMKQIILVIAILNLGVVVFAETKTLYENNFEKAEVGQVPSDFLVLDGAFVVKEESGNKFLELPGTPLDSFAVQFGPVQTENVAVSARINGIARGRRYPTFGVGINGAAGYRLQIAPAKKM